VWFQTQMARFGFEHAGKFSPFPPPTALVLLPLAWLDPPTAFAVLTVVNIFALAACIWLFSSITGIRGEKAAALILAAGLAIINCLRFGQLYIILVLLLLFSYRSARRGEPVLAGVFAGLLLPVKYFPVIVVAWFLVRGQWKSALAVLLTSACVVALSLVLMGPRVFETFFLTVLPDHLASRYEMQSPYAAAFQSWDSLLMRLFMKDSVLNPGAIWDSPALYVILKAAILTAGGGVTLWISIRLLKNGTQTAADILLALAGVAALLFAPGTATYHFVLLWLPLALVVQQPADHTWLRPLLILMYAAIGWIPYSWFRTLGEGGGIWVVFDYPRLFLLTLLFGGLAVQAVRVSSRLPSLRPSGATGDVST